jgi:DNA replication initiation complex subunit (GINS family)
MTREEKIKFIQKAVFDVEGVTISDGHFDDYTEEMLNEEVEFYDYVLDK